MYSNRYQGRVATTLNALKKFFRGNRVAYLFIIPALAYMLFFVGYPIIKNIIMGFQNLTTETFTKPSQFVGFSNYYTLFKGELLNETICNTIYFTFFSVLFQFLIGFALALFFSQKFILAKPLRGLVIISWLIPVTITALVFKLIFTMDGGILNVLLHSLGIINKPIEWLIKPSTAMWSLILANVWIGVPFYMIMLATGLTAIPIEIYESAVIDGANSIQKFFLITIPSLKPVIGAVLMLGIIYTFKVFDLVYVMTGGGPVNATELLSTYSYRLSFNEFNFSKGAAVANVFLVLLFVIGLWYLRLIKDEEVM